MKYLKKKVLPHLAALLITGIGLFVICVAWLILGGIVVGGFGIFLRILHWTKEAL